MKHKKRLFLFLAITLMLGLILTGCGKKSQGGKADPKAFQTILSSSSQAPQIYFQLSEVEAYLNSKGYKAISTQEFSEDLQNNSLEPKSYWVDDGTDKTQKLPDSISAEIAIIHPNKTAVMVAQFAVDQNKAVKKGAWLIGNYDTKKHALSNQRMINGLGSLISE